MRKRLLWIGIGLMALAVPALADVFLKDFGAVTAVGDTDNTFWCQVSGGCTSTDPLKRVTAAQIWSYVVAKITGGDFSVAATGIGTLATVNASPGNYTNANISVDNKGRVTTATNGSPGTGGGIVVGTTTITGGACPNGQNIYNNAGIAGCQANGTGGGAVSITSLSPGLLVAPNPLTGTGTLQLTNAQSTPGASGTYTVATTDAGKQIVLATGYTGLAVPAATGSFSAGTVFSLFNKGPVTATAPAGTTINGIAGPTGIKLGANQGSDWSSDGANWFVDLKIPQPATQTGTTVLGDDMAFHTAGSGTTVTIASGTAVLGTSAIASAACAAVVQGTPTATGTLTTDTVMASFNGDPTAVTGYIPATAGMLTIISYPTAGNVNFKVCNNTNASITPGAITLNWRVVR